MLTQIRKDMKRFFRDRKALMITILMPTILIAILGSSVGKLMDNNNPLSNLHLIVVNETTSSTIDHTTIQHFIKNFNDQNDTKLSIDELVKNQDKLNFTSIFINEVLQQPEFKSWLTFDVYENKDKAIEQLEKGKVNAVVDFPKNFNTQVLLSMLLPNTDTVTVNVIQNPDEPLKSTIVKSLVEAYTKQLSESIIAKNTLTNLINENPSFQKKIAATIPDIIKNINQNNHLPVQITKEGITGKNTISGIQYYTVGMAVMFMLYTATMSALYMKDEIRFETYNRLRGAGISIREIILGKIFSSFLLVVIQILFLFLFSKLVFQMSFGNPILLLTFIIISALSVSTLAALFTTITVVNQENKLGELFQSILIPFVSLLGGSFISTTSMPKIINLIGHNLLNGASLQGFIKIMQGYSFLDLSSSIVALCINSIGILFITWMIVKANGEVFQ